MAVAPTHHWRGAAPACRAILDQSRGSFDHA